MLSWTRKVACGTGRAESVTDHRGFRRAAWWHEMGPIKHEGRHLEGGGRSGTESCYCTRAIR